MNTTFITTAFNRMSHGHLAQSRPANQQGSLSAMLRDEQLKARALQRWENEGGRICPGHKPQSTAGQMR